MQAAHKPVLACWLGGAVVAAARLATAAAGIASHHTPERATAAWLQLVNFARNQRALQQLTLSAAHDLSPTFSPDRLTARRLIDSALQEGREWLGDADSQALLAAYGLPVVATRKTADTDSAVAASRRSPANPSPWSHANTPNIW